MACKIYYLTASSIITGPFTYTSCSGNTVQFLPTAGRTYVATANDANPPISNIEISVNSGPFATTEYYFSSCCGDISFKVKSNPSVLNSTGYTLGSDLLVTDSTTPYYHEFPICANSYTAPTGTTTIPELTLYEATFTSVSTDCTTCNSSVFAECYTYFRSCCNNCNTDSPSTTKCYFALSNLPGTYTPGNVYSVTHVDIGSNVCLEVINPNTIFGLNNSPLGKVVYLDGVFATLVGSYGSCTSCISSHPCPTTTPTGNTTGYYCGPTQQSPGVFTIFPMSVTCSGVTPTSSTSYNGSLTAIVTGGTSPYSYVWSNGATTQTASNLGYGDYTVTVTDYYGDFILTSTCSLNTPTPTPTPTPPPTPTPTLGPDFCMTITDTIYKTTTQIQYTAFTITNGKSQYSSSTTNTGVYYNSTNTRWELTGYTPYVVLTNTTNNPPLNGWTFVGGSSSLTGFGTLGTCTPTSTLSISVTKNSSPPCNSTLTITATGGTPPYQYSKDNGTTYQSVGTYFTLCNGTYNCVVKDSTSATVYQTITLP
jgi:hypothetical protein